MTPLVFQKKEGSTCNQNIESPCFEKQMKLYDSGTPLLCRVQRERYDAVSSYFLSCFQCTGRRKQKYGLILY